MEPAQSQYAYTRPAPARTRAGLVVLAVVITEIVLIGGGANQWVTDKIVRRAADASQTVRLIDGSWLVYEWRFTPRDGQDAIWGSQLLLILTVLVVSALLVWVVVRGPVSFGRAFFGTWLAVIVASLLGGFVRGLVYPHTEQLLPGVNRVVRAVYSGAGPSNAVVAGSFALGLVVALVAGLIAATTGRRPAPAPSGPPEFADYGPPAPSEPPAYVPPWQDSHYGPPPPYRSGGEQTTRLPSLSKDEQTTQLPREPQSAWPPAAPPGGPFQSPPREPEQTQPHSAVGSEEPQERTQAYPAVSEEPPSEPETERPSEQPSPASEEPRDEEETARFPRPPDDDELGHIEQ